MHHKIQFLFTKREGASLGILEAHLAAEGQRIRGRVPKGALHRRAIRLIHDPTRKTVHGSELGKTSGFFDAMFEIGLEEGQWTNFLTAVQGMADRMKNLIDQARSAAIAGVEHTIIGGEHPLILVFALRRLPDLTPEAFHDYWLNKHAEKGRAVPGLQGYRQFHAQAEMSVEAARAAGVDIADFDGVAEAYYSDLNRFLEMMSKPEVASDALKDEKRFIDHSRSFMGLYRLAWSMPV